MSRLPPDSAIKRISRGISSVGRGCHRGGIESVRSANPLLRTNSVETGAMGMNINRRDLLLASGLFLLARTRASGQGAPPPRAQLQNQGTPQGRLLEALQRNRLPLTMSDGDSPAGRGWDWLVREARDARFTLIGEEHGV